MKNSILLMVLLSVGPSVAADRFDFVFSWGRVKDEESARAFAEIGVTDIIASGEKGYVAAKKYGLRAYCGFGPCGLHDQVVTPEEKKHLDYLNVADLRKKLPRDEFKRVRDERRKAARCQFGGEPVTSPDLCPELIVCFLSDTNCVKSKARLEKTLAANPLAEGVVFDYIGYSNLHSCECADCQTRRTAYLKENALDDTESNRNKFFRKSLVGYINSLADHARGLRPGIKVSIHLYPAFVPDPLYGKDLRADYIQQTVAWYFPWPKDKIADYTRRILADRCSEGCQNVPFVGLNATEGQALGYKSPARLEEELKLILASGARSLGVCNGADMLKSGYREVFMKYTRGPTAP